MKTVHSHLLMALILLGAMLAGCAQVSRPDRNLAERLEYNEAVRARYQLDPDWWLIYNDEELNRLVALALANNIDLAKAAVSVNRALFQAKLLAADLVPIFSGGLEGSARKNIREGGPSTRSIGGNIGLSYELDLWRRVAGSVSAAAWEYQASIEDEEATRLAIVGSVVDAYYQLAYLNDALAATEQNLRNYRSIETTVSAKHQAGKVAAVEPAQARQSILNTENTKVDYLDQRKTAEQTLRNLLNLSPDQALDLKGPSLAKFKLPEVNLSIPLSVLANRPDLRAAEFRVEKAFKQVEAAEKGWLPAISLSSALSSSGPSWREAWSSPIAGGTVSISLPFLDWSNVLYNLRISEADFENVRLDFEQTLTTALNEVDTYYYSYRQSLKTLSNTRRKYAYDLRISNYYQDRYQAGAAELSDWLSALNTTNSSRLSALSTLYQSIQTQTMLHKALAGRYVDRLAATTGR